MLLLTPKHYLEVETVEEISRQLYNTFLESRKYIEGVEPI